MTTATQIINRAYSAVTENHEAREVDTSAAGKEYTAILLRLAADKPQKSDANNLTEIVQILGYCKADLEADLDTIQSLLKHRKRIVDGETSWKKVCELRAKIMKCERLHETNLKELQNEKRQHESAANGKNTAPARMLEIRRKRSHLFRQDNCEPVTLLCEKPST